MSKNNADAAAVLLECNSWAEIHAALTNTTEATKGDVFEVLVQAYLRLDSKYDFKNVWSTHGEVPKAVLSKLNLFNRDVTGLDLVAETPGGKFWAVQAKYHQDEKRSLSRKEATGLIAGRNRAHGEFELGLICTTANGRSANLAGEPSLEYLMGDVWRGLDGAFFERLHAHLRGLAPSPPEVKTPRPHQQEALDGITAYFADHSRGKVVMPCATGKSLIGFWSAERLKARRVLVAVPNLSLVRQLLKDWTEQSLAHGRRPRWIVVCSDDSVADSVAARDLGVKVDTDPTEVAAWLKTNQRADLSVVFTTYQSGRVLGEAAKKAGVKFDLGIFDEAHRTAGREGAPFAYLLSDDNITVRDRVFMTATPRIFKGKDRDDVISMGDPVLYGGDAFKMTFLSAMERGIIPNLTIVAVTVAEREVERLLRDRQFIRLQAEHQDEVIRAEDLVAALALRKAMKKYGIRRTLGFHSSRKRCRLTGEVQRILGEALPEYGPLDVFHVDGEMTSGERDSELRAFEASENALLTNVRVFVEGVDCPSMDAVIFADPRQSTIDIVQGVGRALRPFPGKDAGYAIIPTIIEDDGSSADGAYDQVVRVACALGSENEVILDYFAAIAKGEPWSGPRVFEVLGDVEVGVKIDLEKVNRAVAVRAYERTVEWRPFQQARSFARSLGLQTRQEWEALAKAGRLPADIPVHPERAYLSDGWIGTGDWLGTGRVANQQKEFRSFEEARTFARSLRLKSAAEWFAFAKSEGRPDDIPVAPNSVYKADGWVRMGDWLGTGTIAASARVYWPFKKARARARALDLKNGDEWRAFCRSGDLPDEIPAGPARVYRDKGWCGMGDWLGTGAIATRHRQFLPFKQARAFARRLGLKNESEWRALSMSDKRPDDVPSNPHREYRKRGWVGMGDWLGTGNVGPGRRDHRAFNEARIFAQSLGLKNGAEWFAFARTKMKPKDIPATPDRAYRDDGWAGMGDWLGTGTVGRGRRNYFGEYRAFNDAQAFAKSLGLKSAAEWTAYAKSGKRPTDIPASPALVYRSRGWRGMGEWLGTGTVATNRRIYRPFPLARTYARSLKLKNASEWRAFAASGKRLKDIPSNPSNTYRSKGWVAWGDWLGTGRARRGKKKRT